MPIAIALVFAGAAAPALAVPGQTIAEFKSWASSKPHFLSDFETTRNELSGMPAFHVRKASRGITWDLQAQTNGRTIVSEIFGMSSTSAEIGSEPIRHDGTGDGFSFFSSVYGPVVAADYRTSKLVASLKDPVAGTTFSYYKGRKFGYAITSKSGMLEIETPAAFAADLHQMQHCLKHPNDCNE